MARRLHMGILHDFGIAHRGHEPGSAGVSPASCCAEIGNTPARRQRSAGWFMESHHDFGIGHCNHELAETKLCRTCVKVSYSLGQFMESVNTLKNTLRLPIAGVAMTRAACRYAVVELAFLRS